jgi:hypothetical protein
MQRSLIFALGTFTASLAHAAQFSSVLSTQELVESASRVVHGTVIDTASWKSDAGLIKTTVTLEVDQAVPAMSVPTVQFNVPYGVLDGIRLSVPGSPPLEAGDEVVVFLDDEKVVGLGQGVLHDEGGRWVQRAMPQTDTRVQLSSPDQVLGAQKEARACAADIARSGSEDGWTTRSTVTSSLVQARARGIGVGLMEGLSYRITICSDLHAAGISAEIFDGNIGGGVHQSQGSTLEWVVSPKHSGEHLLAVELEGLKPGFHRSAITVGIAYR